MHFTLPIFTVAMPEIFLLTLFVVILLADLFLAQRKPWLTYILVQGTLLGAIGLALSQYQASLHPILTFSGHYLVDPFAILLKVTIYSISFFSFWYARDFLQSRHIARGDYYLLSLLAVLAMSLMASAYTFLTLYLGLELLSLALYALVALQKESFAALEAAMKYFIMGSVASALLLYGMSMVYGATGTLQIVDMAPFLAHASKGQHTLALLGLIFMLSGMIFKLGAIPFHMWVPDVYDGAPAPITLFIASATKIAAFGMMVRVLVEALPTMHAQWTHMLMGVAVLSMLLGNLMAIAQTKIKRMLAYSSIAHVGYILLGIIAGPNSAEGYSAAMFYMVTYAIVAAGAFGAITLLSKTTDAFEALEDYKGLNARHPWLAFLMLLLMFSMAGVPPTVGFFAKLGLIEALVNAHLVALAAFALLFSIVGAYYYLRIVMYMYFEAPNTSRDNDKIKIPLHQMVAVSLNGSAVLLLGILPSSLIDLCRVSLA